MRQKNLVPNLLSEKPHDKVPAHLDNPRGPTEEAKHSRELGVPVPLWAHCTACTAAQSFLFSELNRQNSIDRTHDLTACSKNSRCKNTKDKKISRISILL